MAHNHNYEPMPNWVIWAGVGIMVFTVVLFVLFTFVMIYGG
jgi:hypothetical protein